MKIHIRERNVQVTEVLRSHVQRRVGLALGRFGERIGRVIVRFSDTDGLRSRVDKRCQIEVGLRQRSVRVEDMNADVFTAVDHAADRVSRSVARALERQRDWGQSPIHPWTSGGSRS